MCGFLLSLLSNHQKTYSPAEWTKWQQKLNHSFQLIKHRGPDVSLIKDLSYGQVGFHRLSIMGPTPEGHQPFFSESGHALVCNGEIYNYLSLKNELKKVFQFRSESDCEVLLPLYEQQGIEKMVKTIKGEFAFCLWNGQEQKVYAARDPLGIRPLFYGLNQGKIVGFASEAKALIGWCEEVVPFPPGHYYDGQDFHSYTECLRPQSFTKVPIEAVTKKIRTLFEEAVLKRLHAHTPIGYLLSGGLDSSLVCAISQKHHSRPIQTFAIGMEKDPIDLKYAKEVADYIGSEHHEVFMCEEDVLGVLKKVIWHLETYDITTIRASIGMYLVCRYVRERTGVKVLLTGEVSDELFGYKYTDFAPTAMDFQNEAYKRMSELYMYDVLRADRCISAHGLEARVPFSDEDFIAYVMSIDPKLKMNKYKMGKYLLRKAFEEGEGREKLLPDSILWRQKAAFSDAVGHSMVDCLKAFAESSYTDGEYEKKRMQYKHATPFTKESLLYREIFEEFYPGRQGLVKDFWMPNQSWPGCQVQDPSARFLANYGTSGE